MGDEELGAIGVGSGVSHRQDPRPVVLQRGIEFVREFVARAAAAATRRVAALGHETGDHPVEERPVIELLAGKKDEVVDCVRGFIGEQLEHDISLVGVQCCLVLLVGVDADGGRLRPLFGLVH
jgi:hypothetical protein